MLEFIFSTSNYNHKESGLLAHPFMQGIKHWFEQGTRTKEFLDAVLRECWRLTEKALAFFIVQATKVDTSVWADVLNKYAEGHNNNINGVLLYLKSLNPSKNIVAKVVCAFLKVNNTIALELEDSFLNSLVESVLKVLKWIKCVRVY